MHLLRIWTEIWLVYPLCFSYQNASKKQQKRTVAAHAIMSQLARWVSTQHFDENFCLFLFSFVARFESSDMYSSMTTLLTHTVAHATKPPFRSKINNQPLKKFLSLALSWTKVVKNGKILTFKVNFLCQKISESF